MKQVVVCISLLCIIQSIFSMQDDIGSATNKIKKIQLPQLITNIGFDSRKVTERCRVLKSDFKSAPLSISHRIKNLKWEAKLIGEELNLSPQSQELLCNNLIRKQKNQPYVHDYAYNQDYEIENYDKIIAQWHPVFGQFWQDLKKEDTRKRYILSRGKELVDLWYKYAGRNIKNRLPEKYHSYKYHLYFKLSHFVSTTLSPQMRHILVDLFDAWLRGKKINPDFRFSNMQNDCYKKVLIKKLPKGFGLQEWCLNEGSSRMADIISYLYRRLNSSYSTFIEIDNRYIARDIHRLVEMFKRCQKIYISAQSEFEITKDFCRICKGKPSRCSDAYDAQKEEYNKNMLCLFCQILIDKLPDETLLKDYCTVAGVENKIAKVIYGYFNTSDKNHYKPDIRGNPKKHLKKQLQEIENKMINKLLYKNKNYPCSYKRNVCSSKTKCLADQLYPILVPMMIKREQEVERTKGIQNFFKLFQRPSFITKEKKQKKIDTTSLFLWPLTHKEYNYVVGDLSLQEIRRSLD